MKNSPCLDCSKRCEICHASCKEYHDWVASVKKENENRRAGSEGAGYARDNYVKVQRRKRR